MNGLDATARLVGWMWPARLLAELLIIVVGVLIALQLHGWRQDRQDRHMERQYLVRLLSNLERDVRDARHIEERSRLAAEHGMALTLLRRGGDAGDVRPEAIAASVWRARASQGLRSSTGTYTEMLATGTLTLVRSAILRSALANYYRQVEQIRGSRSALPRDLGRWWAASLAADDHEAIVRGCRDVEEPLTCRLDGLESDLSGFAAAFMRDPAVGGALNTAFNRASATANIARTTADQAQELYDRIAAELALPR